MAQVNVRKRGTKYQYYFETAKINGRRKRVVKSGFKTKKEAYAAGVEALNTYNNGGVPVLDNSISVASFIDQYLEYYKNTVQYRTYRYTEGFLKHKLAESYGGYNLSSFNRNSAENFIFSFKNDNLESTTIDKYIITCRVFFDYAVKMKVVRENPFDGLRTPPGAKPKTTRTYYTDEYVESLLDAYKGDKLLEPVIMIGYHTGLRVSEMIALTWDDIDLEKKTINVNKQILYHDRTRYFVTPKYNSYRIISIDSKLVEYLKTLKEEREDHQFMYDVTEDNKVVYGSSFSFVINRKDGKAATDNTIHSRVNYLKTTYGFPEFKVHELRHTHCTKLIDGGVDTKYVQKRLGHKNIQVTLNTYHHLTKDRITAEDDKLDSLF